MARTRKVKSRGKKHKKVKTRQRKTTQRKTKQVRLSKRVKLALELQKCMNSCVSLPKGSKSKRKCVKKHCSKVVNKIVNISLSKKTRNHKHKMRGGYGKGACSLVGAPWNATGAANYYPLSKYGVTPGGPSPYPGNNSPSPQHGGSGGLFQQLALNPYRGVTGSLANLQNIYAGKGLNPSPYPQIQDQVTPQSYFISDVNKT